MSETNKEYQMTQEEMDQATRESCCGYLFGYEDGYKKGLEKGFAKYKELLIKDTKENIEELKILGKNT